MLLRLRKKMDILALKYRTRAYSSRGYNLIFGTFRAASSWKRLIFERAYFYGIQFSSLFFYSFFFRLTLLSMTSSSLSVSFSSTTNSLANNCSSSSTISFCTEPISSAFLSQNSTQYWMRLVYERAYFIGKAFSRAAWFRKRLVFESGLNRRAYGMFILIVVK